MKDKLPLADVIIYDDPKGVPHYDQPWLLRLDRVQARGVEFARDHPAHWDTEVARGLATDLAIINYTSGTTGFPKGVMISHGALLATARQFLEVERMGRGGEILAYLPMACRRAAAFSLAVPFLAGGTGPCPDDASTARTHVRAV